jgi:hypothetical protein
VLVVSNHVPEESVIREQQTLSEKTRFKSRLEENISKKNKTQFVLVFFIQKHVFRVI